MIKQTGTTHCALFAAASSTVEMKSGNLHGFRGNTTEMGITTLYTFTSNGMMMVRWELEEMQTVQIPASHFPVFDFPTASKPMHPNASNAQIAFPESGQAFRRSAIPCQIPLSLRHLLEKCKRTCFSSFHLQLQST